MPKQPQPRPVPYSVYKRCLLALNVMQRQHQEALEELRWLRRIRILKVKQ